MRPARTLLRDLERVVRATVEPAEALPEILRACRAEIEGGAELEGGGADDAELWRALARLDLEREVEPLALALVDALDAAPPGPTDTELVFALRFVLRNERVDAVELELPGRERASVPSYALTRAIHIADRARSPRLRDVLRDELPLALAAALARASVDRIDPELVLGAAPALQVSVKNPEGRRFALGSYHAEDGFARGSP